MSGEREIRVNVFAAHPDEMTHLDLLGGPAACGWPSIDSTEWEKGLDRLAAMLSGRAGDDFGDHELVFPPGAADWDGPWLVRVPDEVVAAIAAVDPEAVELSDESRRTVRELHELCHRACDEHRHVYQWSTE